MWKYSILINKARIVEWIILNYLSMIEKKMCDGERAIYSFRSKNEQWIIKIKAFGNINIIQEDEQSLFKYENKGKYKQLQKI